MELLKVIPKWAVSILVLLVAILISYAVFTGRGVTFWPPSISAKTKIEPSELLLLQQKNKDMLAEINRLKSQVDGLKHNLEEKKFLISEAEAINVFPPEIRRQSLKLTATEVSHLISSREKATLHIQKMEQELEGIKGKFLFRLLSFHRDAGCYGDSLNFTYTSPNLETQNCIKKMELAKRLLGFLAEIEFYHGPVIDSPEIAKEQLIKYQKSKNFTRIGWYGIDVFKWIVIDYHQKV